MAKDITGQGGIAAQLSFLDPIEGVIPKGGALQPPESLS